MKNILLEVEANLHFVFGSSVKLDNNSHEDVTSPWLVTQYDTLPCLTPSCTPPSHWGLTLGLRNSLLILALRIANARMKRNYSSVPHRYGTLLRTISVRKKSLFNLHGCFPIC